MRLRHFFRSIHSSFGVRRRAGVFVAAWLMAGAAALAQTSRVIPTIPAAALPGGIVTVPGNSLRQPQIVAGKFDPYQVSGNVATITQKDAAGILNWGNFDIGSSAQVIVNQPSSSAVLLNKVVGGTSMSVIEGKLTANGQIYLYNPNGIIFGKNSTVDVNSLVATTLKIDDQRFLAGILAPSVLPIFMADPTLSTPPGPILVDGSNSGGVVAQAQITAANGGRIVLVAPAVTNNGKLVAPDGQVVLAAGGKVFLTSPSDLQMRGLVVEVSNDNLAAGTGGAATNDTQGQIRVGRGNATMVGLAVNQMGIVSATTSDTLNGSIYLHARDGTKADNMGTAVTTLTPTHGGSLVLGGTSVTEVLPTLDDTTTTPGTSFNPSLIDLSGNTIHLQKNSTQTSSGPNGPTGASVIAPGGNVVAKAYADGSQGNPLANGNSHIYLDPGAVVDVSGTTATQLAMESNVIQVQLRGTELADSLLQRNSALRGQTVSVDVRKGTPLANIQGWLDQVGQSVGQRTASGGTVTFRSDSDIVVSPGAQINVSGGLVTYLPGNIATTQLTSNGATFDIGSATPDRVYDGFFTPPAGPRNFNPGYVQGYNAGSIVLDSPAMVLQGDLKGSVTSGAQQRNVSTGAMPLGGQLTIGNDSTNGDLGQQSAFNFIGTVNIGGSTTAEINVPAFDDTQPNGGVKLPSALQSNLDLDPAVLAQGGFSRLNVYSYQGNINVVKPLDLAAGGAVKLATGGAVDFAAAIDSPGGSISASSLSSVSVENGVVMNFAGRWTNDLGNTHPALDLQGNPVTPIVVQGGTVSLSAPNVSIGSGTLFDVSGGAWMNAQGKLTGGAGGRIAIGPAVSGGNDPTLDTSMALDNSAIFRGYGVSKGGKLQLSAPNVILGAPSTDSTNSATLALRSSLFQQGGFASYDIRAMGNLTVAGNIAPRMDNWLGGRNTANISSGLMSDAFGIATLLLAGTAPTRTASSINLRAAAEQLPDYGRLDIQAGVGISVDPGGSISLSAGRQLTVDGSVIAPAGNISLALTPTISSSLAYLPERSIWLGAKSVFDASGSAALLWQDGRGMTQGSLLDGGNIQIGRFDGTNLVAAPGYVVVEPGALMNVAGTTASMTLPGGSGAGVQTRTMASAGGSIDIHAREGLLFDGTLSGAGGNSSASGGSLSLVLDRENQSGIGFPTTPLDFVVAASEPNPGTPGMIPKDLQANQPIVGVEGQGFVLADSINRAGFDQVRIKSAGAIDFDLSGGNVSLSPRGALTIDAPTLSARNAAQGGTVSLDAAYVAIGNTDWRYQANSLKATTGPATLQIKAGTADVIGTSTLAGFGSVNFDVGGDVRLVGQVAIDVSNLGPNAPPPLTAAGGLAVAGDMSFKSAQVYPTSLSTFFLNAGGTGSSITFTGNGSTAAIPLSAAGQLTVTAQDITQNGVVRAPLGSLDFEANGTLGTLNFGSNSLTSVAGGTTVPLGFVQNGRDWLYDFGNGNTINLSNSTASNYVALPDKTIIAHGSVVNFSKGATLDSSGGGDLYAYEFTPGPGGSRDVLATPGVYAILPGFASPVAPVDFQNNYANAPQVGRSIYLSGIPGLAAGYYTLLPAHYALLPGAYAVSALAGTGDMAAAKNYQTTLGSWVVAGHLGSLGGGAANRWSGFTLTPAALVRQESEFTDHSGNAFLASVAAALPQDGGHVAFDVTRSLMLDGLVHLDAASGGGQRGIVDISAPEIDVVSTLTQSLPGEAGANAVMLTADSLNALGADSLLLGGVRKMSSTGTQLTVGANQVIVANDAAHSLNGPEIILAAASNETVDPATQQVVAVPGTPGADSSANGRVLLKSGSSVAAKGSLTHAPTPIAVVNQNNPGSLGADGALLRVSSGATVAVERAITLPDGTTRAAAGVAGTLNIEAGATVAANGSATFDATQTTVLAAQPSLGSNAALTLGANRISLGSAAPASVSGLRFDDAALASLSGLSSLALTSYTSIDVYGSVSLGGSGMQNLNLTAPGMQAYGSNADTSMFMASKSLRLDGNGTLGSAPANTAAGGKLTFSAQNILLGNSAFAIRGFSNTSLKAGNDIIASGKGGVLAADANLTLAAGRITADSGSDAVVMAGNRLVLTQGAGVVGTLAAPQLGGKLTFSGNTVASDANIVALSGQVSMSATNGIDVTGGSISAGGGAETFGSTVAYSPGGAISLDAGTGNVVVAAAATLDVSSTGADAGSLILKATNGNNGQVILNGTLKGVALPGVDGSVPAQGSFAMDVDKLDTATTFAALNAKLNDAGFTQSRSFRVRNDDVTLAAGATVTAQNVAISTDNGNIGISGTIDANGSKGGSIRLYAGESGAGGGKGNVSIASGALLEAAATTAVTTAAGSLGDGGSIVIGTSTADGSMPATFAGDASITLAAGAKLDVSKGVDANGNGAGQGGTVLLRAPRIGNGAGSDVAIAALDATITGSRSTAIEAYKVYSGTTVNERADGGGNLDATSNGTMFKDANTFIGGNNVLARLNVTDPAVMLRPGIEVRSPTDLNVSVNELDANPQNRGWDLSAWRFNGQPGVLTLRAANNLTIQGSISDGFMPVAGAAMPDWQLDPARGDSWSYRLAGGSDLAAANPLATAANAAAGDVKLTFARTTGSGNDLPVTLVRTGTGFIDVAAGRDVVLDNLDFNTGQLTGGNFGSINYSQGDTLLGATLYTAGRLTAMQPAAAPQNASNAGYGTATASSAVFSDTGGAIDVQADRNVMGPVTNQLITNWLFRQGRVTTDSAGNTIFASATGAGRNKGTAGPLQYTAWWSRFDYFNESIATFGGGDVSINAQNGNVANLSASVATNAFLPQVGGTLVENGGGDLVVRAGGDIRGGTFYVQKGIASISAAGSIGTGDLKVLDMETSNSPIPVATVLAAGDAQLNVSAGGNLEIESVFNPMMAIQSSNNVSGAAAATNTLTSPTTVIDQFSSFSTYSSTSAVSLTSVSGNLLLDENVNVLKAAAGPDLIPGLTNIPTYTSLFLLHPATVTAAALGGNLGFDHGFSLWPSPTGQLELLAQGSITAQFPNDPNALPNAIVMVDRDPAAMSTASSPRIIDETDFYTLTAPGGTVGLLYHTPDGLHQSDPNPVRIIALTGDINFSSNNTKSTGVTLVLPKAAEISAGRDIIDAGFSIQQLSPTDVTSVSAGRDIIDTTLASGTSTVSHLVSGPGNVDFSAGRNFDLGNSKGVVTRGNLDNPYLPAQGAGIDVVAGASPDYAGFAKHFTSVADLSSAQQGALTTFMRNLDPSLSANETPDAAWTAFNKLSLVQRQPFLDSLFFNALAQAAGAMGGGTLDLAKFDTTIASLFPTDSIHGGDVNVFGSQLKTDRGGAISIYAPGGSVYAGLVSMPTYLKAKSAADLGIFTIGGGALQSLVKTDFLVNQGRVFTLGGGDITLVSQYGNIDAGKGAKTAQASPPPILITDAAGNTQVDISGSISGSGIATLRAGPDVTASNVYPIAPRGIFDAGDAGVRSTGSVNIVAQTVLNANNISAAGAVSGTHADSSGMSGAMATPSNAAVVKTDSIATLASASNASAGTLTVELLGLGCGDSQQNVTQGSQNSPSCAGDEQAKKKESP